MKYQETYKTRLDELNVLSRDAFEEVDKAIAKEEILSTLVLAYLDGVDACNEMIDTKIKPNEKNMQEAIFKEIGGENINNRIDKYSDGGTINDYERLIESEFHRVYNEAIYDTAKNSGLKVYKKWVAIMDEKTRDDHWVLYGVKVGLDDYFYEPSGDYGRFPGDFQLPESNCNCRCSIEITTDGQDE